MKYLLVLAALLAAAWALPSKQMSAQEIVDFVNNKEGGTWKAKLNPRFANMNNEQIKKMLGARRRHDNPHNKVKLQPKFTGDLDSIPASFDARSAWGNCADVIATIADQSACGSCWAVSAASVMSDRICIGTNGKTKMTVGSNDLISCCFDCGFGCQGGWPDEAFYSWTSAGVVTGSSYKLDQGCQPYPFPECEHHIDKTTYPKCPSDIYDTPQCKKSCQASYTAKSYSQDKTYGQMPAFYSMDNAGVQNEIMKNGPVVFTYDVYEDFINYQSGVYQHTTGKFLGGHAVRAIGWGTENGVDYWLIANSWNEDWGDNGYFKIIRGVDNCGIEEEISAAIYKP